MKRDKFKCSVCGSIENLCVHHIDGYDEYKPENNFENKMIVLCRCCHRQVHEGVEIPKSLLESIDYFENNDSNELCNTDVTNCNTYIEIEKRDKIKDIEYFSSEKLNEIFSEFLQMRKKIKAVNSDRAINTIINKLNKYDDDTKYKMIENSIVNSWKDVYELKQNKKIVPSWINNQENNNNKEYKKIDLLAEIEKE